jgi:hypothetical protein
MHSRRAIAVACEGVTTVRHVTVDKWFAMCLLACLVSAGQAVDGEHALSHCVGQSLVASVNTTESDVVGILGWIRCSVQQSKSHIHSWPWGRC